MELSSYRCPNCGSNNLESFKDENKTIHIRCEDCNKILKSYPMKKYPPEIEEAKKAEQSMIPRVLPILIMMIIFTIAFALLLRHISLSYGLW